MYRSYTVEMRALRLLSLTYHFCFRPPIRLRKFSSFRQREARGILIGALALGESRTIVVISLIGLFPLLVLPNRTSYSARTDVEGLNSRHEAMNLPAVNIPGVFGEPVEGECSLDFGLVTLSEAGGIGRRLIDD